MRSAALGCSALLLTSCLEPEILPSNAEVRVVIDTDVDTDALTARLQIDLYDEAEGWFFSRELLRQDPEVWPTSFTVLGPKATDEGARERQVLVRIRLYPDGKYRDYRGERFFPLGFLTDPEQCLPLLPPTYDGARDNRPLVQRDEKGEPLPPVFPQNEPQPNLAIDRFVLLNIVPGRLGEVRVTLRGECVGRQADFGAKGLGDESTCVDDAGEYASAATTVRAPVFAAAESEVGTFPGARPCQETPRDGAFGSFEDEVCVDGGLYLLGDPLAFGYGDFDGTPERMAVVSPFLIDKYEVTVGRFRKALESGKLGAIVPPTANESALDFNDPDETRRCTFSAAHLGREAYPLNCVSWETAAAFCAAEGGTLPTEAQWEYVAAAAGRDGNETRYAWGSEEPTCARAVFSRAPNPMNGGTDCANEPADVGVQPLREDEPSTGDRTRLGVVGMGGSLREMVSDAHRPYCSSCWVDAPLRDPSCTDESAPHRTLRGGDWSSDTNSLLVGVRNRAVVEDQGAPRIGFRCVRGTK